MWGKNEMLFTAAKTRRRNKAAGEPLNLKTASGTNL